MAPDVRQPLDDAKREFEPSLSDRRKNPALDIPGARIHPEQRFV
jgi:hypothetical protein